MVKIFYSDEFKKVIAHFIKHAYSYLHGSTDVKEITDRLTEFKPYLKEYCKKPNLQRVVDEQDGSLLKLGLTDAIALANVFDHCELFTEDKIFLDGILKSVNQIIEKNISKSKLSGSEIFACMDLSSSVKTANPNKHLIFNKCVHYLSELVDFS